LAIFDRLPPRKDIIPVYAVIVFMVYGWTIFKFNYAMSGWLFFLTFGEVVDVLTYVMTVNFFESAMILLGIVALAVVLPRAWFADAFVARGAVLSASALGLMMYVADQFGEKSYYPSEIVRWLPAILLAAGLFVYALGRVQFARKAIEFFADRSIIFLYVSIPVSILSALAVLARNLF